jgi:hypothetical protein
MLAAGLGGFRGSHLLSGSDQSLPAAMVPIQQAVSKDPYDVHMTVEPLGTLHGPRSGIVSDLGAAGPDEGSRA